MGILLRTVLFLLSSADDLNEWLKRVGREVSLHSLQSPRSYEEGINGFLLLGSPASHFATKVHENGSFGM